MMERRGKETEGEREKGRRGEKMGWEGRREEGRRGEERRQKRGRR